MKEKTELYSFAEVKGLTSQIPKHWNHEGIFITRIDLMKHDAYDLLLKSYYNYQLKDCDVRRDALTSKRDFINMMLLTEICEEVLLNKKKMLLGDTFQILQSILIDLSRILYGQPKLVIQELDPVSEFKFSISSQIF